MNANTQTKSDQQALSLALDEAQKDFDGASPEHKWWAEGELHKARMAYWQYRRNTELEPLMRWLSKSTYHRGECDLLPRFAKAAADAAEYLASLPETATARARADAELAEEKATILYQAMSDNYGLMLAEHAEQRQRASEKRKRK